MPHKVCFASVDVEKNIENLAQILNIFKKHNVPATLFVTGRILAEYSGKAEDWAEDYEIACHSFTHRFWNALDAKEREKELDDFIALYRKIFNKKPLGFRAPSHIVDEQALKLLEDKGFLYDSSIVPHYPPFKKYRGYRGRFPLIPYRPLESPKFLEIPVAGQIFGIPLAAAWLDKLPLMLYKVLFSISCPGFIALSWHSWNNLSNLEKIIKLLKNKKYQFLNGEQIHDHMVSPDPPLLETHGF